MQEVERHQSINYYIESKWGLLIPAFKYAIGTSRKKQNMKKGETSKCMKTVNVKKARNQSQAIYTRCHFSLTLLWIFYEHKLPLVQTIYLHIYILPIQRIHISNAAIIYLLECRAIYHIYPYEKSIHLMQWQSHFRLKVDTCASYFFKLA